MKKAYSLNRYIKDGAISTVSLLLTFIFFWTSFQHTYNACIIILVIVLFEIGIYYLFSKNIAKRGMIVAAICGLVLSITSLVGQLTENDRLHLLKSFDGSIKAVSFVLIHAVLYGMLSLCLFIKLEEISKKDIAQYKADIRYGWSFNKIWCLIMICWLPYCIMHFPARFGGGSSNQIAQFQGQDTLARQMSSVIYEGHYITNHHPVLLTYFYGIFYKIGDLLGDVDSSLFLLSSLILVLNGLCMAYLLKTVEKYVSTRSYIAILLMVCLHPIFGIYSYTICKDNLFASALVIFYALILEVSMEDKDFISDRRFKTKLLGISICIPFLKNQGLLVIVISLILIAIFKKNVRIHMLLVMVTVTLIYGVLFSNIVMPILKIAPVGKQAALSIPFQQTALYVKKYGNELTQDEFKVIDAILPAEEIAELYVKDRADAVTFRYKQDATRAELIDYFSLWAKCFFRHPDVYFKAFFAITDGYYYIWYDNAELDLDMSVGYGASTPEWVLSFEEKEQAFWSFLIHIPVIGCFFRAGIFIWTALITLFYCIYRDKKEWMLILIPVFLNLAVCMLCPRNGMIRFALPIIYAFPALMCILGRTIVNEECG